MENSQSTNVWHQGTQALYDTQIRKLERLQEFVKNILSKIETPQIRDGSKENTASPHFQTKKGVCAGQEKDFVTKPFGEKTWY